MHADTRHYLTRFLLVLGLLAVFIPVKCTLSSLNLEAARPVSFVFTEDMYYQTARMRKADRLKRLRSQRRKLQSITAVYLAGSFNGWNKRNPAYRMQRSADKGWTLQLDLPAGRHTYKFVVYPAPDKQGDPAPPPVWLRDYRARLFEDDGYGGKNSLLITKQAGPVRFSFSRTMYFRRLGTLDQEWFERQMASPIPPIEIRAVYVAGRFSDWEKARGNPNYRMQRTAPGRWQLSLSLAPARHHYKYIIHYVEKDDPQQKLREYWCEDIQAREFYPDSFGGRNSIRTIRSYRREESLFTFVMLALILWLVLYTALELLLKRMMRHRISLKYKLLAVFMLLLLLSNLGFLFHARSQQVDFARRIQVDKVNTMHSMLLGGGVDFTRLNNPRQRKRLAKLLHRFFTNTSMRQDYLNLSNTKQQLNRLFLLDKKGHIIAYAMEPSLRIASGIYIAARDSGRRMYYSEKLTRILNHYRQRRRPPQEIFLCFWSDYPVEGFPFDETSSREMVAENRRQAAFFPYDTFVYPIYSNLLLQGYYVGNISPVGYSALFRDAFYFNLLLLLIVSLLFLLLISRLGGIVLEPLHHLMEGIDHIKEGNLEHTLEIDTGDEVGDLGKSYNYMREKLLTSRNRIQEYTDSLQSMVEKRTTELRSANKKLKEADRIKNRFFANVAHETKTPLTLIANYLDSYIERVGMSGELAVIKQNIEKLARDMINFLDAEKLRRGQTFYQHDQFLDLEDLVHTKTTLFQAMAQRKQISMECHSPGQVLVKADPFALDRIMNNLLDNAIRYSNQGGQVAVRLSVEKKWAVLDVEDNGVGISKAEQRHIFKQYHQISHHKRNLQGIGMGLYIVERIVRSLGGRITVASQPDQGSCFTVRLPLARSTDEVRPARHVAYSQPADLIPDTPALQEAPFAPERPALLVVEDNPGLLGFLHSTLSPRYNVFSAGNGREALDILENKPRPALILSDIMMDEMDGFALQQELANDDRFRDLPFIFLTARTATADRLQGLKQGAIDFISKPFTVAELLAKIEALIRQQELRRHIHELDKYAALGRLVSGISHEIFNPLFGIKGLVEYLARQEQPKPATDQEEVFSHIMNNIERVEGIVRSLRMLNYKGAMEQDWLPVRPILDSITTLFRSETWENIDLVIEAPPDLELFANRDALVRILLNLVSNAVDALEGKGHITITVERKGDGALLSVMDNGPGIARENLSEIFDLFYTTKGPHGGTGMGLYIVKDLVLRLGWTIDVHSRRGRSTTFIITIGAARG